MPLVTLCLLPSLAAICIDVDRSTSCLDCRGIAKLQYQLQIDPLDCPMQIDQHRQATINFVMPGPESIFTFRILSIQAKILRMKHSALNGTGSVERGASLYRYLPFNWSTSCPKINARSVLKAQSTGHHAGL